MSKPFDTYHTVSILIIDIGIYNNNRHSMNQNNIATILNSLYYTLQLKMFDLEHQNSMAIILPDITEFSLKGTIKTRLKIGDVS